MSVLFWNDVALEANKVDHSGPEKPSAGGPGLSSRALAIVHAAMADAFANAMRGGGGMAPFEPGFVSAIPPIETDPAAALAGAAHQTLAALYPRQRMFFDNRLAAFLQSRGLGPAVKAGLGFGRAIGQAVLNIRAEDGAAVYEGEDDRLYRPGGLPYMHDEDPMNPGQGFLGRRWGLLQPFALTRSEVVEVLPPAPPPIADPAYQRDHAEVHAKGRRDGGTRTEEETEIGLFWAYDGARGIGTPPRLYNQAVRAVGLAEARPLSEVEWIRLLAQVNLAMADAGIVAWHAKYVYNVWRPILGIRHHPELAHDGAAQQEASWEPLGAPRSNDSSGKGDFTPPFPAYPSGHATFGAACFGTLRAFRAARGEANPDAIRIELVSDELDGTTRDARGNVRPRRPRCYSSLRTMTEENLESRVFLGVHWRFDGVAGAASGSAVAERVASRLYAARTAVAVVA